MRTLGRTMLATLAALLAATAPAAAQEGERDAGITPEAMLRGVPVQLPVRGDGASVLAVQTLLDRTLFSPGILDGRWGKNTEKAVRWFQRGHGLEATGRVDEATLARLRDVAGTSGGGLAERHTLTAEEVEGPFVEIPEDVYEQAELECMCYESLAEKLAETFHTSPRVLERLNPGIDLNALSAGDRIVVPAVREEDAGSGAEVARIVVSDGGHWVHALDAEGNVVFHFPSTLGSDYAPSPTGDFRIASITRRPTWHYQPDLLTGVPDERRDAVIPPGPNNAVGLVWVDLSKPHYGIHGTSAPATIGYVTSHGCVRLTNWDALFLAGRVEAGTPVEFVGGG